MSGFFICFFIGVSNRDSKQKQEVRANVKHSDIAALTGVKGHLVTRDLTELHLRLLSKHIVPFSLEEPGHVTAMRHFGVTAKKVFP